MNNKLNQWLALIDDMDGGRIKMAEEKNETIKSALDELGYLTGDAEAQRIAELQEKWEMDWNSGMGHARREGKEEGIKEGIEKGNKEAKLETAKKMLEEKLSLEIIVKVTGLTREEILKIK